MSKKILYLGNILSENGSNLTTIETLSQNLQTLGYEVKSYSNKQNKFLRLSDMLVAVIKHRNFDYLLIDTYSTSAFWFAYWSAKLARWCNLKYIPILHGGELPNRLIKNPKQTKTYFSKAYFNVAPSLFMFDTFKKAGFENVVCIPNSIKISKYPFKKREKPEPKLLWVRAFAELYNPLLALKVLKLLLETYPNASLSMVGPKKDSSLEMCKTYAKQHNLPVTFTGKLSKTEWINYAKGFDIFINTTSVDNTPVSVIEAMALGLPVVTTNVGGIPYLVEDKINGLLVNPNNEGEMLKAIKRLMFKAGLAEDLSIQARKTVERFDWEVVKIRWENILN
jgi:glycosyltransferase involved in cell wall biosynthesis